MPNTPCKNTDRKRSSKDKEAHCTTVEPVYYGHFYQSDQLAICDYWGVLTFQVKVPFGIITCMNYAGDVIFKYPDLTGFTDSSNKLSVSLYILLLHIILHEHNVMSNRMPLPIYNVTQKYPCLNKLFLYNLPWNSSNLINYQIKILVKICFEL